MKTIHILSLLLVVASAAFANKASAQCCPYMDTVEIFPSPVTTEDSIYIRVQVTSPNYGFKLSNNLQVVNDTIYINVCYHAGPGTELKTFVDTFKVGLLPAGMYGINLRAYLSLDTVACDSSRSNYRIDTFTVVQSTSILERLLIQRRISLYPNPTYSDQKLSIRLSKPETLEVSLLDLSGRHISTIFKGLAGEGVWEEIIPLASLQNGCYLLRINTSTESQTLKVVKY